MKLAFFGIVPLAFLVAIAQGKESSPNCSEASGYATSMAFTYLKNAGLLTNETTIFSKTAIVRIASEMIAEDLYRQVHRVSFVKNSGEKVEVITVNDVSHEECSMSGVDVFVVSKHLGGR